VVAVPGFKYPADKIKKIDALLSYKPKVEAEYFAVKDDKMTLLWGFRDKTGNIVIKHKYQDARDFKEGMGAVKMDGKWGFVNYEGTLVIPCKYEYVESFLDGKAYVKNQTGKKEKEVNIDYCSYYGCSASIILYEGNFIDYNGISISETVKSYWAESHCSGIFSLHLTSECSNCPKLTEEQKKRNEEAHHLKEERELDKCKDAAEEAKEHLINWANERGYNTEK